MESKWIVQKYYLSVIKRVINMHLQKLSTAGHILNILHPFSLFSLQTFCAFLQPSCMACNSQISTMQKTLTSSLPKTASFMVRSEWQPINLPLWSFSQASKRAVALNVSRSQDHREKALEVVCICICGL